MFLNIVWPKRKKEKNRFAEVNPTSSSVRVSSRKAESEIAKEKLEILKSKILHKCEEGIKVVHSEVKGRGIFSTKSFVRGEFVVEYLGQLIEGNEGKRRNIEYAKDVRIGSYLYYFKSRSIAYCVDATAESIHLGRLANHSKKNANLQPKVVEIDDIPHLIFLAKKDIKCGEELLFDYGERNAIVIHYNPWLNDCSDDYPMGE